MKKFLLFIYLCTAISLISCRKEFSSQNAIVEISTQQDFKSSPTGVSLAEAENLAIRFLESKLSAKKIAVAGLQTTTSSISVKNALTIVKKGKPYFHLVNTNKGYVLLAPDSLYAPILAYDSIGSFSFDTKDLNTGLVRWLNKHAYELDYVRNNKNKKLDSIGASNKKLWKIFGGTSKEYGSISTMNSSKKHKTDGVGLNVTPPVLIASDPIYFSTNTTVGPLCQTAWSQDYPYNQYCPAGTGGAATEGHMPTGCVATAMAQIMYYWQWPNTYDWNSMVKLINPANSSTLPTNNPGGFTESARLVSDIGYTGGPVFINAASGFSTSQFMYYTTGGSSADDAYCPYVFGAFNYSSSTRTESISSQIFSGEKNGTTYADLLTSEVQNYRPCILSGYSEEVHPWYLGLVGLLLWEPLSYTGHSWVCDGSDVTTFYSGHIDTYQSFWGDITYETYYDYTITNRYLHMNWGWGPTYQTGTSNNGWFNCDINYTAAPSGRDYSLFQTVIYNIHP